MRSAEFYESIGETRVKCLLCPHGCLIDSGETGICGVRRADGDQLVSESYGRITSLALDPVEKKPLYHFHPGGMILSLGSYGCNFRCGFCQNHEISMQKAEYREMLPEELAALSLKLSGRGNVGLAFTYNEPVISYEFVLDCARLIRAQNQKNVLVTNGFIGESPLKKLLPLVDAMNIDLKCFSQDFYRQLGGELEPVKQTIDVAAKSCHCEVTTLIIPGKNDSPREMEALSEWLASVSPSIPLHLSRFFPRHKMSGLQPTPLPVMRALAEIASKRLDHVHLGNC